MSSLPPPEMPRFDNGGQNSLNPIKDRKAIAALVFGILGLLVPILGVAALGFGYTSGKNIKSSQGLLVGSGMAKAGIILGAIETALIILFLAFGGSS